MQGAILENTGPVSFFVQTTDGTIVMRHQDQTRSRLAGDKGQLQDATVLPASVQSSHEEWEDGTEITRARVLPEETPPNRDEQSLREETGSTVTLPVSPVLRRSTRISKPLDRLAL